MHSQTRRITHEERVRLAQELCNEIKESLGDDLSVFLIYASVAKNADGPYSDLEMMAVISDSYEEYCSEFMRDGIRCEVDFIPISLAIKYAGCIDDEWPINADQWHRFQTIYVKEGEDCILRIREAAERSLEQKEKFNHEIIMAMLVGYEEIGKIKNARSREGNSDMVSGLSGFAMTVLRLSGFVNHHFFQSQRNAWVESKTLPNLPKDYVRLIGIVQGEVVSPIEARYNAALELWENVQKWAKGQGIEWETQDLEMPKKKES